MADPSANPVPGVATRHRQIWLLASLAFVLLRAIPNISYPIGRDQATFLVIGRGILDGQHLYQDLWDNKPPGIFFLSAVIVKVFGPVMWSVGLIDILWLLGFSYCVFRFTERYLGPAAATVAVIVNATWHVEAGYWQAAQTETFLILCVFLAFFLVASVGRWGLLRHALAGVLCAAAFWLKYNAIVLVPVAVLIPYLETHRLDGEPRRVSLVLPWRQWIERTLAFGGGFVAAVTSVLIAFRFSDSWEALKEVQFDVLPRYSAMTLQRTPHYLLWALYQTESVLGLWTEIAFVVAIAVAWKKRELGRLAPILFCAVLGFLCVALQARFHAYGFETAFPFFAMAWGYLGIAVLREFRQIADKCSQKGWKLARLLVWVLFANVVASLIPPQIVSIVGHYRALADWARGPEVFYTSYPWANPISHLSEQMRVISYLRRNLTPGDGLFVWGSEPLIYFLTGRPCTARFVTNLALMSPWSPPKWRDEMVRDLGQAPPRFLVVARDDAVPNITYSRWDSEEFLQVYPEFAIFISDHYEQAVNLRNFAIYERRSARHAQTSDSEVPAGGRMASAQATKTPWQTH
ncbi:MAG: ArnT family glycosyltransferase [Terriglobia bacterium]